MWSIRILITVSLSIPIVQGHIGLGGGYQPSSGCSAGSYSLRQPPPCGGHMPTPLPYAPVPPPYPTPPYQAFPPPQNCRSCPWRNPLPPMIPPPQILPIEMTQNSYATRLPIEMAQDSYATLLPIPAQEKLFLKEKKIETKTNSPFEETPPPKIPLPATLASEDSDKDQPFVRPLTYESLPPRYENQPPKYPTYPPSPMLPEPVPPYQAGASYQAVPPPVPPYQAMPPPVPPPKHQECQPYYRPVHPNSPPPQPTHLRPMQPPPLNNCCARCDRGCKHAHAHRRAFVTKTKNATNNTLKFFDNLDFNNPSECTSKQLKNIIKNNAAVNMTIAKEVIQRTAEKELGDGVFHVICSSADLEYTTRTFSFCFGEVADGICYVFRTN